MKRRTNAQLMRELRELRAELDAAIAENRSLRVWAKDGEKHAPEKAGQ